MNDSNKDHVATGLGEVTVLPDGPPPGGDVSSPVLPAGTARAVYQWTPGPKLSDQLPAGFSVRLRCITGTDGVRRFFPVDGFEAFIIRDAFTAGLALLCKLCDLTPEQRQSYRYMFLLFQRVRRTKEHLTRALLEDKSLRISRVGRERADERSILPDTLGLDEMGRGEVWGVDRLLAEGRQACTEAGINRPGEADCIRFGLTAAARLNPLHIPTGKVPELVRQALYAEIELDEPLGQEVVDVVVERTLAAIHQHLEEPAEAFSKWFWGGHNSLVAQVGKRKLAPGGRVAPQVVRRALLDQGWQAYAHVGSCVDTFMRVFERLLAEPLTDAERACFEQMYLNQPVFGNLPLALLFDRFPFLAKVLADLVQRPGDPQALGAFYRVLDWYGDMARRRRQVDRDVKRRRPADRLEGERTPLVVAYVETHKTGGACSGAYVEPDETDDACSGAYAVPDKDGASPRGRSSEAELFEEVADVVAQRRQLRCTCGKQNWTHRPVQPFDGQLVTIEHACSSCQFVTTTTVPVDEFRLAARGQPA